MFNTIMSMAVAGVITASGAHYLQQLEVNSTRAAERYATDANERFQEYEKILPGSVLYPNVETYPAQKVTTQQSQ